MRSGGPHCIISGLILPQHRFLTKRPSAFSKQGRQLLLPLWFPSCQTSHQRRRPRKHRRLQQRQVQLRRQQRQLRPLQRYALLPHPGRIHRQGNAQRRIPVRERGAAVPAVSCLGGTRCPQRVGKCTAATPPNLYLRLWRDSPCHRLWRSRSTLGSEWIDSPRPLLRTRA
jgi:hypothetical protein